MSAKAISPTLQENTDYEYTEEQVIQDYSNELPDPNSVNMGEAYQTGVNYSQQSYGYTEENGYQEYQGYNGYQDIPENPRYPQNGKFPAQYANQPVEPQYGYDGSYQNGDANGYEAGYDSNFGNYHERKQSLPNYPKVVRRTSLDDMKNVVNGFDGAYVQDEFGKIDNPGGLFKIIPLETQLSANYVWEIPKESLKEEKLVSLPFGPREWSWQIILYPQGTGEALGQSMSAFLRPLKNEAENANENWTRPISKFIFSLKRNPEFQNTYGSEFDENYAIQYSQDDFKEFSQAVNGWGFQDFCTLPLNESDVVSPSNTIRIVAQVYGPLMLKTSTILYEQPIVLPLEVGQEVVTNAFGPPSCQWEVKLNPIVDEFGNLVCVSGYLFPVKTKFELSLGNQWDRIISTFTLKLVDSNTMQNICSKSVTGGYSFSEANPTSGWDSLVSYDEVQRATAVTLHAEVTWDPNSLNENTVLGKVKAALQNSSEERYQIQQRVEYLENELVKSTETEQSLSQYIQKLNCQINEQQSLLFKNQLAQDELDKLRQRVTLLTTELEEARNEQVSFHSTNVRLSTAKARIAEIRTKMDNDEIQPPLMPGDIYAELAHYKAQLAQVFHEKAQVDLKLSQSLSELHFVHRSKKDEVLLAPIQNHEHLIQAEDSIDPLQKIQDAMDNSRSEIAAGRAVLDEINAKTAVIQLKSMSNAEKVGLVAEISMIQCQLDVAAATMYELQEEYLTTAPNPEFSAILNELEEVRSAMTLTRQSIERNESGKFNKHPPNSNIAPPPIVPSVNNPKLRKGHLNNESKLEAFSNQAGKDAGFGVSQPQLDLFTGKLDSVVDLIKNTLSTPRESVVNTQKFELQIESWPARDENESKLDAVQLQMLLKELKQSQSEKVLSWFYLLTFIGTIYFAFYSTIFIVCNPSHPQHNSFQRYQPVCNTVIMPLWENVKDKWHSSCEKLALEILPSYAKKFTIGARRIQGIKPDSSSVTESIHPKDHNVPKTDFPTGAAINPSDSVTSSQNVGEKVEELYPAVVPILELGENVQVDLTTSRNPAGETEAASRGKRVKGYVQNVQAQESISAAQSIIPEISSNFTGSTSKHESGSQDENLKSNSSKDLSVLPSSEIDTETKQMPVVSVQSTFSEHGLPEISQESQSVVIELLTSIPSQQVVGESLSSSPTQEAVNKVTEIKDLPKETMLNEEPSPIIEGIPVVIHTISEKKAIVTDRKEEFVTVEEERFTILPYMNDMNDTNDTNANDASNWKNESKLEKLQSPSEIEVALSEDVEKGNEIEQNQPVDIHGERNIKENSQLMDKIDLSDDISKSVIQEQLVPAENSSLDSTLEISVEESSSLSDSLIYTQVNDIPESPPNTKLPTQELDTSNSQMNNINRRNYESSELLVNDTTELSDNSFVPAETTVAESSVDIQLNEQFENSSLELTETNVVESVDAVHTEANFDKEQESNTERLDVSDSLIPDEIRIPDISNHDSEGAINLQNLTSAQEISHSDSINITNTDDEEHIKPSYEEIIPEEDAALEKADNIKQIHLEEEEIITASEGKEKNNGRNRLKKFNQ
ncbi:hypothetical protein HDV06_005818 [Boothiomyces sp. JEL0866]|nr:hypothetical protein HDV06_005818 [Boothiomyces sp. JEL0866]